MARRRARRVLWGMAAAGVLGAPVSTRPLFAEGDAGDAPPPSQWPSSSVVTANLEAWPNALRYSGNDRYQTSMTVALGLRGMGDYPFDTPDPSSGGASVLATANDWWGAGTCPRAIIVVAGDNPADALAASALSDPTHQSTEPWLERTDSADPSFFPIGGFTRVDTDSAPILITASARSGASTLSPGARLAANDLRQGGCTTARQAIVVGGTAAVPSGVDTELISLGYREVFRVAGTDRFHTAALLAQSLGTRPAPGGDLTCDDPLTTDGSTRQTFYANSVVELRESATDCRLLSRTVVIADGVTGADALAAGWWTGFWQVPVLLHDGDDTLPPATVAALASMNVSNIIVLGGTSRISDDVVAEAENLTGGADVVRIAGADRYETSVMMAKLLGGWWPIGDSADFAASMVCLAASAGNGATATGWPDALGAGPFCGAIGGAASNPGMPTRALPAANGAAPTVTPALSPRPAHDAVPILLVPTAGEALPASVADLLAGAFDPNEAWCSSEVADETCMWPGFVVGFGGGSVLSPGVMAEASLAVGGGVGTLGPLPPTETEAPWLTDLDMAPVFDQGGIGATRMCAARGTYADSRWLAVYDRLARQATSEFDIMVGGRYLTDVDGLARSPSIGGPVCALFTTDPAGAAARFVGVSGRVTPLHTFDTAAADRFSLDGPLGAGPPVSVTGSPTQSVATNGSTTVLTFLVGSGGVASSRGESAAVNSTNITLTLQRPSAYAAPFTFSAAWSLSTPSGTVAGTASGEALFVDGVWQLRGQSEFTPGTWNISSGKGGFSAALSPGDWYIEGDESVAWQVDGVVSG